MLGRFELRCKIYFHRFWFSDEKRISCWQPRVFCWRTEFCKLCISSEKLQLQQTLMMIDMHALFINYHRFACSVLNSMTIKKYKRWNFVKLKVRWVEWGWARPQGRPWLDVTRSTNTCFQLCSSNTPLSLCETCAAQSMHVWFSIAASAVPVGNRVVTSLGHDHHVLHATLSVGWFTIQPSNQHLSKEQLDCPLRLRKRRGSDSPFLQPLGLPVNLWWKPF